MQNLLARKYVNNFKKDGKKEKCVKDLSTLSIDDMKTKKKNTNLFVGIKILN